MEIEEIAEKTPEKILTVPIQLDGILKPYHAIRLTNFMGWKKDQAKMGKKIAMGLAKAFIETVADEAAGEIGVLAGCSGEFDGSRERRVDRGRYVAQSIELAALARERGADGAVLVIPYAFDPGASVDDTIVGYFEEVCAAVDIPVVIYQAPGIPPQYQPSADLMRRLVRIKGVRGIKVSTSEHEIFDPVAEGVKDAQGFALIAGSEYFLLEALKLGAVGCIGGGATTQPELIHALQWHYERGNLDRAAAVQAEVTACEKALAALDKGRRSLKKIYVSRKGYPMAPFKRPRGLMYGGKATRRGFDSEVFADAGEHVADTFVAPYREAAQAGREPP